MAVWTRVQGLLAGAALGGAARSAFEGVFEVTRQNSWARRPFVVLAPGVAARVRALGIPTPVNLADDARRNGLGAARFDLLTELARTYPDVTTALDLWRRGVTGRDDFELAMRRQGYPEPVVAQLADLRSVLASPSDVIRWAVREAFNPPLADRLGFTAEFPDAFADYAARLGIPRADAERHWIAHWQLPSATQVAEMLHRGIIEQDTYDETLKALDYPLPWRDRLRQLTRRVPPLSDLIRFSVREVYQDATASKYGYDDDYPARFTADAALHGMAEDRARQYWRAHWRLPSPSQAYTMLHRGEISEAELDDLLRVADYPSFWRRRLAAISYRVLTRVDLRRLRAAGLIDRARTKRGYRELGYRETDAELLTDFAESQRAGATGTRDLTLAHWQDEYLGGFITETRFRSELERLGYDADERDQLVQLADARKVKQARDRAVAKIGAQYVAYTLSRTEAEALLRRTTVRPEARDRLLDEWETARAANVKQMTAAQVRAAFKKGVYSRAVAFAELIERGWRDEDANAYLDSA